MKKVLLVSAVALFASSVFAGNYPGFRQLAGGSGSVNLFSRPDLDNKGMTIVITGSAAKVMFNKLSNNLLETFDGNDRINGQGLSRKMGKNVSCTVELDGKEQYECAIQIQDNSSGEVAEPGVG